MLFPMCEMILCSDVYQESSENFSDASSENVETVLNVEMETEPTSTQNSPFISSTILRKRTRVASNRQSRRTTVLEPG